MEKFDLLDICPVCSAKNIHLLDDMCEGCAGGSGIPIFNPFFDSSFDMNEFINSYFMGGLNGKT